MPVRNGGPHGALAVLCPKANHRHIITHDDSAKAHSICCEDANASLLEGEGEAETRRSFQPTGCGLLRLHPATEPAALRTGPVEDLANAIQRVIALVQHWWDADKAPHPKIETIARRMGKSERMVLRYLDGLEKAGLIKREHRFRGKQKQISSAYRLEGLRERLIELEPEFRKAKEFRDKRQKAAETAA
ncbi:MAG TPA: helix-turn-helix domain-containing protein [Methylosinus sp.]|jgi:DNA-binding transcriptional ArsR family regulator|uniref:helix-turn-helix domain-containing protein n=1 Tax=Methylosinus sp. TaxID=427 RepID=UPI002F9527A5